MADLSAIPDNELTADLAETLANIDRCRDALKMGITHFGMENVAFRFRCYVAVRDTIIAEQRRRQAALGAAEEGQA